MPDPAINPNAPRRIPVARPTIGEAEAEAAKRAILAGWVSGGPRVEEFERVFAQAHGKKYGVACNSGTSALHLALAAFDIGPGDEVVVPVLAMAAVANAVLYCGARPVFVDSQGGDGNADGSWLADRRIAGPRVKAAIAAHLYGVPAVGFLRACRKHLPGAVVIEDCAEAHYAAIDGEPAGSFGTVSCWSFYGNKIVTTGEGGMVSTNDANMAERLRSLRAHAFTPGDHFHHQSLAFGYRMTEMAAAVGLVQHARRQELLARRKELARRYFAQLQGLAWATFPERTFESAWWVFPVLAPHREFRDRLRARLANAGVETRTYFVPLHRQPHLRKYATCDYPAAESLSARGFYLPLYPDLTDDDVDYICEMLRSEKGSS